MHPVTDETKKKPPQEVKSTEVNKVLRLSAQALLAKTSRCVPNLLLLSQKHTNILSVQAKRDAKRQFCTFKVAAGGLDSIH